MSDSTTTICTGVPALDTLLFGDPLYRDADGRKLGLVPGEIVLIRGEPGTGKTTLALQIVTNALRTEEKTRAWFITVEESRAALERKIANFGFHASERLQFRERDQIQALVRSHFTLSSAATGTDGRWANDATTIDEAIRDIFAEVRQVDGPSTSAEPAPTILVIDSINAFMNILLDSMPSGGRDDHPRLLFNAFCRGIKVDEGPAAPIVILTGEFHFERAGLERYLAESFFCDVEIDLRTEPVRATQYHVATGKVRLGYDLNALIERDASTLETRSFCRVLKSRNSSNQSRRCAYDIERDRGLQFYETYPGDGKILLFAENEQQRHTWRSFFERDLPDAYPALRHELFGLANMQTVYESARRLQHMPLRTDMLLCSLDSYWVIWYRDYRLKKLVNGFLLSQLKPEFDRRTLRQGDHRQPRTGDSKRACIEYPALVNDVLRYCLQDMEHRLYQATGQVLRTRDETTTRVENLQRKTNHLGEQKPFTVRELTERHDKLCQLLFGKNVAELLASMDREMPAPDLRQTFLRPLPRSQILLYGQYHSDLLRSLRREDMHQYVDGEDYWLSVPYDANVGIFVARLDYYQELLERIKGAPTAAVGTPPPSEKAKSHAAQAFEDTFAWLKQEELGLYDLLAQPSFLDGLFDDVEEERSFRQSLEIARAACEKALGAEEREAAWQGLSAEIARRLTWDQVICLHSVGYYPFGIETRSFDTLLATFLEMVWNCGGRLKVDASYRIENKAQQLIPLVLAMHYFSAIFQLTPTSPSQTIDPGQFRPGTTPELPYGSWLFCRYWYSTLIDALTAKFTKFHPPPRHFAELGARPEGGPVEEFVWRERSGRARIEIVQMPRGTPDEDCGHHTCWGEWNLALLAGSENVALACDLVSNLMGALKVTERALRGATLPTVRHFYDRFRDERCIPAGEREDLKLPAMTFHELLTTYLEPSGRKHEETTEVPKDGAVAPEGDDQESGIFRQFIFDYRHCGREIYSALLRIKSASTRLVLRPAPADDPARAERIVRECVDLVKQIEKLRMSYIFIGESFDHDVLRTGNLAPRKDPRFEPARDSLKCAFQAEDQTLTGTVLDLSRGGCRVRFESDRPAGTISTITLLDLDDKVGREVRKSWDVELGAAADQHPESRERTARMMFERRLDLDELEKLRQAAC